MTVCWSYIENEQASIKDKNTSIISVVLSLRNLSFFSSNEQTLQDVSISLFTSIARKSLMTVQGHSWYAILLF